MVSLLGRLVHRWDGLLSSLTDSIPKLEKGGVSSLHPLQTKW